MQELPELWHLDKRLKFKAELTRGMMEGLTHIAGIKKPLTLPLSSRIQAS